MRSSADRAAPLIAGAALALVYAATAATSVTFWDAGEFLAAFHTLGIPHPPGTPLFVAIGRLAVLALRPLGPALPGSLISAACSAAAGALAAWLVARWTRSAWCAVAAALCGGATSSLWFNATEPEVYAAALFLVACTLAAADRAGRAPDDARWPTLVAYLFALAVPLHLSALVAAPAAALLAATPVDGPLDLRRLVLLGGAFVTAAGAGTINGPVVLVGVACIAASVAVRRASGRTPTRRRAVDALRVLVVLGLGLTGVLVLLLRARHDPVLDQGHPATWRELADVVARRQYALAPLWPRQAPWWLQLGNVGEWADWQFAVGLDGDVGASLRRTPITLLFAVLGLLGARELRRADRRAFRATLVLLLAGSLGVAAYLNMKAGPSFGWGVLPDTAPREARERDYFFVLAFWTWGLWAGIGAVAAATAVARAVARRVRHSPSAAERWGRWVGLALAVLPLATNWRATTRRHQPDAALPHALAEALLASAPRASVLLLDGDNDTYPTWYLQLAEGARGDVTPVTLPLLGAPWYRAELARRHALLPLDAPTRWDGMVATARAIVTSAVRQGRPVAASVAVADSIRARLGGSWTLAGLVWVWTPTGEAPAVDSVATRRIARLIPASLFAPLRPGADAAGDWAQRLLRCPAVALGQPLAAPAAVPDTSLDAPCNPK